MNLQNLFDRLRFWWSSTDRTQKMVTGLGALVLVVLVAGTIIVASRPKMEALFPGATPNEQGIVRDAVMGYGFPVDINPRGDVLVPADKMPEIRMRLSQDGKIPTSSGVGGGLINPEGNSMFQSPSELERKLNTLKENDLARSIMTLQGVQSALVHINFGKDTPFGDTAVPPSAVVNIVEKAGAGLTADEGRSIARLVQNSVPGLEPASVTVISSTGRMIYDGEEINSEDSGATKKLEAEREESRRREKELQRRLDLAFGAGATIAMVQVELNMDEVTEQRQQQTPGEAPLSRDTTTEELIGSTPNPPGPAGSDVNLPGQPAAANTSQNNQNYRSEATREQFPHDTRSISTKRAAGQVDTLNVNVLVDAAKVQDVQAVRSFVDGLLVTRGERNFRAVVTPTSFSQEAVVAQSKLAGEAVMAQRMQQLLSILPILALLGIGFMLIKALGKGAPVIKNSSAELAIDSRTHPGRHVENIHVLGSDHYDRVVHHHHDGAEGHPHEIHVHHDDHALVAKNEPHYDLSQLDDLNPRDFGLPAGDDKEIEEMRNGLASIIANTQLEDDEPVVVGEIREKVDVPLEQIRKLAKERPETVATLLKTWIMEDN